MSSSPIHLPKQSAFGSTPTENCAYLALQGPIKFNAKSPELDIQTFTWGEMCRFIRIRVARYKRTIKRLESMGEHQLITLRAVENVA